MVERKRVIGILNDDPVKILKKTKKLISKLKEENETLKKQVKLLLRNNKTFTELVEVLDEKILKSTEFRPEKYVYSYERGGWIEKDSLDKERIELKEEKLNLSTINEQLSEIIRLIKLRKVRNLNRE